MDEKIYTEEEMEFTAKDVDLEISEPFKEKFNEAIDNIEKKYGVVL